MLYLRNNARTIIYTLYILLNKAIKQIERKDLRTQATRSICTSHVRDHRSIERIADVSSDIEPAEPYRDISLRDGARPRRARRLLLLIIISGYFCTASYNVVGSLPARPTGAPGPSIYFIY